MTQPRTDYMCRTCGEVVYTTINEDHAKDGRISQDMVTEYLELAHACPEANGKMRQLRPVKS